MPFKTTNVRPDVNALVTIKFSGLMVLQPGPDETCNIGLHRLNRDHSNQVLLIVHKPGLPVTVVPLLTGPLTAPLVIKLSSEPELGDFTIYERDPFDRTLPTSDVFDHRWAINLRPFNPEARLNYGAKPIVTLRTGTLYTSNLSNPALDPKFTAPGVVEDEELNQFAGDLAAAITPPADTKVILEWEDHGDSKGISLPRLGEEDDAEIRYTVCFINEPPNYASDTQEELPLYYKVLHKNNGQVVPEEEQCTLKFTPGTRSDEVPCMPIILNP